MLQSGCKRLRERSIIDHRHRSDPVGYEGRHLAVAVQKGGRREMPWPADVRIAIWFDWLA
jgi:hypothetical protein